MFDAIAWEAKFYRFPNKHEFITVFKQSEGKEAVKAAKTFFLRHREETRRSYRAAFLASLSTGCVLIVTEEEWKRA